MKAQLNRLARLPPAIARRTRSTTRQGPPQLWLDECAIDVEYMLLYFSYSSLELADGFFKGKGGELSPRGLDIVSTREIHLCNAA